MNPIDDATLEAMLAAAPVPDDGFTAAVMRRVHEDASPRSAPTLDAAAALAALRARAAPVSTKRRWTAGGAAVGTLLALGAALAPGSLALPLDAAQTFALLAACAVSAWVLATHALHEQG